MIRWRIWERFSSMANRNRPAMASRMAGVITVFVFSVRVGTLGLRAAAGPLSFCVLVELFEDTIQLRLSFVGFAGFDERLELLFHPLGDGRGVMPADGPFLHARLYTLDLFSKALARRFDERRTAVFGDFFQFGLLLRRKEILDPGEQ